MGPGVGEGDADGFADGLADGAGDDASAGRSSAEAVVRYPATRTPKRSAVHERNRIMRCPSRTAVANRSGDAWVRPVNEDGSDQALV